MIGCVNNADVHVSFNHGNAGGLCAVGDVYNCVNRGMVQHQLNEQEIGWDVYIGGLAGRGSVVNSVNQGAVDSRCIGLGIGSNGAHISGLASSSSILNSCNQGDVSIFPKIVLRVSCLVCQPIILLTSLLLPIVIPLES